MDWKLAIISILELSKKYGKWSFPTNPISAIFYLSFALYGYYKLKRHYSRPLAFLYAVCILGALNFVMENVWLHAFFLRFHWLNNGWLEFPYLNEPFGWILNYYRNFAVMFILYYISRDAWNHVTITKRTFFFMSALSVFLFIYFFFTSSYAQIDWGYGLHWGFNKDIIVNGFLLSCLGKPILFGLYQSVWSKKE